MPGAGVSTRHIEPLLPSAAKDYGNIATHEAFGDTKVRRTVGVAGIATGVAFGTALVVQQRLSGFGGIASREAFGTLRISRVSGVGALGSAEAFGLTIVVSGPTGVFPVDVTPSDTQVCGLAVTDTLTREMSVGDSQVGAARISDILSLGTVSAADTLLQGVAIADSLGEGGIFTAPPGISGATVSRAPAVGTPRIIRVAQAGGIGSGQALGQPSLSTLLFPTTPIIDLLTRTEDPLSDGGKWTQSVRNDGTATSVISSTAAGASTNNAGYGSAARNDTSFGDCEAYVTVASVVGSEHALLLRWNAGLGYGYIVDFFTTNCVILRVDASGTTNLTSLVVPALTSGDVIGAKIIGGTITAYKNGTAVGSVLDSTFTTGYLGMEMPPGSVLKSFGGGGTVASGGGGGSGTFATSAAGAMRWGGSYDNAQAATYGLLDSLTVDLNGVSAAADLPGVRVLFYRSCCSVNTGYDTSIPWSTANGSGWLLRDSGGNLLTNGQYPQNNIGDISNADFATAVGNNAVNWCNTYGFKGIWCDDGVAWGTQLLSALPNGWTQAQWHSNMVAHIGRVGAIVKAAGLEFALNANGFIPFPYDGGNSDNGVNTYNFWNEIIATGGVTGLTCEYWEETADGNHTPYTTNGPYATGQWAGWRALHGLCNANGIDFMPFTRASSDSQIALYARATFLLDYNGGTSVFFSADSPDPVNSPGGLWMKPEGAAAGNAVQDSTGTWHRVYANGTITVNTDTAVGSGF